MNKKKVLIVDDEADFLEIMGTRIEEWGYDLLKAANGKEALAVLKESNPDIIILDYMMPVMDGIATLKEIRKIDKEKPVIMFTAYPDKTIRGASELGISALIPKLSTCSDVQFSLKSTLDMLEKKISQKG